MKFSFLFLFIALVSYSFAQSGRLTFHGKVENKGSLVPYTTVEIYKDNIFLKNLVTQRNGSFRVDLPLGHVYNVAFSKDGYVNKSVGVISKGDSTIVGRYFFQIDIELFRVDQEEIDETMLPPVAKLYIYEADKGFVYDRNYVKWISNEYKDLKD